MSSEMQNVLDEHGRPTGDKKSKEQIFSDGDFRLVTHAWAIDSRGNVLCQQRAYGKGLWDGLWDVTIGGGVAYLEDSRTACVRELAEELELHINESELVLVGRFETSKPVPERDIIAKEFSDTYIFKKEITIEKLNLQESEVQAVAWVPIIDVGRSGKGKIWIPHSPEYYKAVAQKCRELLS